MTLTVLHVVEAFSTGIIQSIRTICRALEGEVSFHVLYGRRPETPADVERQYPLSVGFTPWGAAGRAIDPGKDRRAIAELKETVARVKPDIIHAHSSKAGAYARLAYPRGQVPILYSPRGYSFLQLDKSPAHRSAFRSIEWALGRVPHITVGCGLGEYSLARSVARRAVLIPNLIDPGHFPGPEQGLRPAEAAPLRGQVLQPLGAGGDARRETTSWGAPPSARRWWSAGPPPPRLLFRLPPRGSAPRAVARRAWERRRP